MIKTLRPYQAEVVTEIRRLLKESDEPILVNASVGAGKSLIIAEILLLVEKAGFRALCLTLNSSLIQQNANAYKLQGGSPGIYCAGLNSKATEDLVIFASPHSVCQGIRNANDISKQPFQLVIIDECHNIAPHNKSSMYMRILNHYSLMAQSEQYKFKIIGLTGTPYRGKSESIVGREQLFKKEACAITTSWLIEQGFLTPPKFGITKADGFDFSSLRIQKTGKFDSKQLSEIVDSNERLTGKIMRELVVLAKNRKGVFIFASTVNHCHECAKSLPPGEWAIITGETPHEERKKILEAAREGTLRYLINVNVLTVGVDIPAFDVCAWLRPTESLVLYTQGIGRVLRLHPKKKNALILDYSGNLDRHGDIDDPFINAALSSEFNDEKDYVINCYSCETLNTVTARRCIGTKDGKRCDHYFEFVECLLCKAKNDIAARNCRICGGEIIDPNAKLQAQAICLRKYTYQVLKATSFIRKLPSGHPLFQVTYTAVEENQPKDSFVTETIHETYALKTKKGRDIFYHEYIKQHHQEPSLVYPYLRSEEYLQSLLDTRQFRTPNKLECVKTEGSIKIKKKHFLLEIPDTTHRKLMIVHADWTVKTRYEAAASFLCVDSEDRYIFVKDKFNVRTKKSQHRLANLFPDKEREIYNEAKDINLFARGMYHTRYPTHIVVGPSLNIIEYDTNIDYLPRLPTPSLCQEHLRKPFKMLSIDEDIYSISPRRSYIILGARKDKLFIDSEPVHFIVHTTLRKDLEAIELLKNGKVDKLNIWSYRRDKYIESLILTDGTEHQVKEDFY